MLWVDGRSHTELANEQEDHLKDRITAAHEHPQHQRACRLWTFTMSCCISSAVCCSLLTASMSGVALGYNYSLAEYIDLKETNVSVYLKRGVFDDDIADDIDWRRSGRMPISGHVREDNLLTGSDESTTMRSGRRLDDSIYESNDRNNFEGSLMRLTAKAPDPSPSESTSEVPIGEIIQQYSPGSLDQLKAVQGAINMKKAAAVANRKYNKPQEPEVPNERTELNNPSDVYARRAMVFNDPPFGEPRSTISSLREAVPDDNIANAFKWRIPKVRPKVIPKDMLYIDDYASPTYPQPVTPKPGPIRPTRPKSAPRMRPSPSTKYAPVPTRSMEPNLPKSIDEVMESFKGKVMVAKPDTSGLGEEFLKKMKMGGMKADVDYDEDIKGVPMRKKRSNHILPIIQKSNKKNTISENVDKDLTQENLLNSTLKNPKISTQNVFSKVLLSSITS